MARYDDYSYRGNAMMYSPPVKLHFAGWETDTHRMQNAGWQISANEDVVRNSVQLAFNHPEYRIRGISEHISHDYRSMMNAYDQMRYDRHVEFNAHLASDFHMHIHSTSGFGKFVPIDAEPQYRESIIESLSEARIFAPNLVRTQEIILPEYSVDDMLNMLLEKQAPNREQLIMKRVRENTLSDFKARQHVHAQIISIAA